MRNFLISREAATDTREMMAAAHAAAAICRPFRAPQFCYIYILGLTPQAKYMSPLRGLAEWRPVPLCGLTPQAKYLSPLRGLAEWRPVPPCGLTPQAMDLSRLRRLIALQSPIACF